MKNCTPQEFILGGGYCEKGIKFAKKFKTMHDCYESLLNYGAGDDSLEYLFTILIRQCDMQLFQTLHKDPIIPWWVNQLQPIIGEELAADMIKVLTDGGTTEEAKEAAFERVRKFFDGAYTSGSLCKYFSQEASIACGMLLKDRIVLALSHIAEAVCAYQVSLENPRMKGRYVRRGKHTLYVNGLCSAPVYTRERCEPFLASLRELGNPFGDYRPMHQDTLKRVCPEHYK